MRKIRKQFKSAEQNKSIAGKDLKGIEKEINTLDKRVFKLEKKVLNFKISIDKRFDKVDKRFDEVDKRFDESLTVQDKILSELQALREETVAGTYLFKTLNTEVVELRNRVKRLEEKVG